MNFSTRSRFWLWAVGFWLGSLSRKPKNHMPFCHHEPEEPVTTRAGMRFGVQV